MVYGTVQRHQGTLGIDSESGKGTSFIMRLPVPINPSCHISEDQVNQELTERHHVLVVDDEPLIRQLLSIYLVLCHNICVLIQEMHELGVTPTFEPKVLPESQVIWLN